MPVSERSDDEVTVVTIATLRSLLEALASMYALYYELACDVGRPLQTPDASKRASFLAQVADEFPEIAWLATAIEVPRAFVPRPSSFPPAPASEAKPRAPLETADAP